MKKRKKHIKDFLFVLEDFLFLTSFFVIPIFFNPFSFRVFEFQKSSILRGFVIIELSLKALELFFPKKKEAKILCNKKLNYAFKSFLFFLAVKLFSDLTNGSPGVSIWGDSFRPEGFLTHVSIFLYLILAIQFFARKNLSRYFRKIFLIQILIINIYGLMQFLGLDPLKTKWNNSEFGSRVFSTLGQPNFFAGYLIISLGFLIFDLLSTKKNEPKNLTHVNLFFSTIMIFLTESRSGIISLMVLVFVFFFVYFSLAKKYNLLRIQLFTFSMVFFSLFFLSRLPEIKVDSFLTRNLNRIQNLFQKDAGSGAIRLEYWKKTIGFIKEKPLKGFGDETFLRIIRKDFPEKLYILGSSEIPDKPHNFFLETAFESGLVGLSLYFISFAFIFWIIFSSNKNNPCEKAFGVSFILSYLSFLFFGFETIGNSIVFFTIIGYLISSEIEINEKINENYNKKLSTLDKIKKVFFIFLLFNFLILSLGVFSINPILADIEYVNFLEQNKNSASAKGRIDYKLEKIENIIKTDPFDPMYKSGKPTYALGKLEILSNKILLSNELNKNDLENVKKTAEELLKFLGENFESRFYLGKSCSIAYKLAKESKSNAPNDDLKEYFLCMYENLTIARKLSVYNESYVISKFCESCW